MVWMLSNYYSCSSPSLRQVHSSKTQNLFVLSWSSVDFHMKINFGSSHSASSAYKKWPTMQSDLLWGDSIEVEIYNSKNGHLEFWNQDQRSWFLVLYNYVCLTFHNPSVQIFTNVCTTEECKGATVGQSQKSWRRMVLEAKPVCQFPPLDNIFMGENPPLFWMISVHSI